MTEVRPDEETVPLLGAEVRITDAAGELAAATAGPEALRSGGGFPAPVREVRCTVRADTAAEPPVHCFEAYLRVEAAPAGPTGPASPRAI
ncbi:hypothetical protein ACISRB_32065, partial [Micromonospora aurantiaca]